jgi:DNA polymerase-1
MRPVILVDSHFLCYRAFYSTGYLVHENKVTGIPYGFLWSVLLIAERFKTNKFIFLWDAASDFRKEMFPEYKANRVIVDKDKRQERELIHEQFDYIRESILPRMSFHPWRVPGMEADDLIASTIVNHPSQQFVIVSSDNDLYQLLAKKNVLGMYDPVKHRLFRAFDFYKEYNIPARDWLLVKCLAGCSSDGVPGIPGVGIKTAIKFIRDELNSKSKAYRAIVENPAITKRNYRLMVLPYSTTPIIPLPSDDRLPGLGVLEYLFSNLGFSSFLKDDVFERWKIFSEG